MFPWLSTIPLLPLSWFVAIQFAAAHDGRAAGNQAFALAALWGVYGLALGLSGGPRVRVGGAVSILALLGLAVVVSGGNGRWAVPTWRWMGYVAVLGGAGLLEWLARGVRDDLSGLAGMLAAGVGYLAIGFEAVRILETDWRHPTGELVPVEILAAQDQAAWLWTLAGWAMWSCVVLFVRAWLHPKEEAAYGLPEARRTGS